MDFLKKLFSRNKPEEQAPIPSGSGRRVRLEEVDKFVLERTEGDIAGFRDKLDHHKSRFAHRLNLLIDDFGKLEDADVEKIVLETNRDITEVVRSSRAHYCTSSKKLLEDTLVHIKVQDDPEKVRDMVVHAFEKLNSFSRQAQIILITFKDEMRDITNDLKDLYTDIKFYEEVLRKDYSWVSRLEEARSVAKELIAAREEEETARKKLSKVEAALNEVSGSLDEAYSRRDKVYKSKDYMHYERLKDELEEIAREKEAQLKELNIQVAGTEKLVGVYLHSHKDVKKSDLAALDEFFRNPGESLSQLPTYEQILKKAERAAASKAIAGKKKKKKPAEVKPSAAESVMNLAAELQKTISCEKKISGEIERLRKAVVTDGLDAQIKDLEEKKSVLEEDKREFSKIASRKHLVERMKLESLLSELAGEKVKVV
ncbi:MAG: hypothetical protein JW727_04740 [Candidatus Aenigmarchaeota archaeon]|nr:hypothetical protein [Candidatus Aenigmarchaeota archaeon]